MRILGVAAAYADRHPERVGRLVTFGAYARGADLASALRLCERALDFPDLPADVRGVLWCQRAVILRRSGQPARALDAFGTAIESAMKGSTDVATALKKADAAINDVIKKQSLAGTAPTR